MTSIRMSPGGALLRASRVFSIPNPLPKPAGTFSSQVIFNSDTATLPYPIYQSIATPQSSLAKGDWGFKRPLPLRATTRTSTPVIRVEAIDTLENVTDFNSAADHTLTLQKWQEMNISISTPRRSEIAHEDVNGRETYDHKSAFDDAIDTTSTAQNDSASVAQGKDDLRWKFRGPWLAGLSEGEFQTYVAKEVRRRKGEFREFLRKSCAAELKSEACARAQIKAESIHDVPTESADEISEEQLSAYINRLRTDTITLKLQIRAFLDLPPLPPQKIDFESSEEYLHLGAPPKSAAADVSTSPYAESGPPKSHPSAGLSYLRNNKWLYNHVFYGPQAHHPPVEARIVMPKTASGGAPLLGVGGVIVNVPIGNPAFDSRPAPTHYDKLGVVPGLLFVEPDKYGGSKTYVEPRRAHIDAMGQIVLTVGAADRNAVAVKENKVDEIPEPLQRNHIPAARTSNVIRQNGSREAYGLSSIFMG